MTIEEAQGTAGIVTELARLPELAGADLGRSEWRTMTQALVDEFAEMTGDRNYIHVDPERARTSLFGGTIAHGYLTLSLLAPFTQRALQVADATTSINYGLNKLRFPGPLPVGADFRAAATLDAVREIPGGVEVTVTASVEVRDQARPALVAECVFRFYA